MHCRVQNAAVLNRSQILLDPGIGFGKNYRQNFEILARLPELAQLGYPIVVGASRKAFIGAALDDAPADQRAWGTAATVAASILGGAHIVRVHDVRRDGASGQDRRSRRRRAKLNSALRALL